MPSRPQQSRSSRREESPVPSGGPGCSSVCCLRYDVEAPSALARVPTIIVSPPSPLASSTEKDEDAPEATFLLGPPGVSRGACQKDSRTSGQEPLLAEREV